MASLDRNDKYNQVQRKAWSDLISGLEATVLDVAPKGLSARRRVRVSRPRRGRCCAVCVPRVRQVQRSRRVTLLRGLRASFWRLAGHYLYLGDRQLALRLLDDCAEVSAMLLEIHRGSVVTPPNTRRPMQKAPWSHPHPAHNPGLNGGSKCPSI